ncbi:MAG TPA: hypothetical protein PKW95_17120 [bacterium]|nr:hypothetical protein [bacterium]
MKRKIWRWVLGIVVILIIVGFVAAWPYLQPPKESKETLEARYAEFRQTADALQARPGTQMKDLVALIDELQPVLKKETVPNKALMGLSYGKEVPCPGYNLEDIRNSAADIQAVLAQDDRLRAIIGDGFAPQQDIGHEADLPNFSWVRKYAYAQLAGAVLEVDQNKTGEATERLLRLLQLSDGLIATPTIIHCFVGIVIADRIDRIIVELAPKLSLEDLARLREAVAKRPDTVEAIFAALRAEIVATTDEFSDPVKTRDGLIQAIPALGWLGPILPRTGIVRNARWNYLSISTRIYDFYDQWRQSGPQSPPPELDKAILREYGHNIPGMIAIPNYQSILERCRRGNIHKKAVLGALDGQLAALHAGTREKQETPYDDTHRIVIDGDHGCIVTVEGE